MYESRKDIAKIIDFLLASLEPVNEIDKFSDKPGIYAIGYRKTSFPLVAVQTNFEIMPIVYIGKTESSQLQRDKNTHFASGKTGHSTVRRTLGAVLRNDLALVPEPRKRIAQNDTEVQQKRKTRMYKFDVAGEERLTKWMNANLSLSFWEFDGPIEELKNIEAQLVAQICPLLNLGKNPGNPYRKRLMELRKECRELAGENSK